MELNRIAEERKRLGLNQSELASKVGVSQKSISKYELGTRSPSYDVLNRMATLFNVSIDYLLGFSSDPHQGFIYPEVYISPSNRFGTILQDYISSSGTNKKELSTKLGISEQLIQDLIAGVYTPTMELINKLSTITGYDVDYLTGATDKTSIPTGDENGAMAFSANYHFKARFEEICMEHGINYSNCQEKLALDKDTLMDIKFNRMPTLSEILKISYFANCSIDYLLGKTDVPFSGLSHDEFDLVLNYRECIEPYKKNIRERASKLSMESISQQSVAADEANDLREAK